MELKRVAAGLYESDAGHEVRRINGRWYITWPGRWTPDVERPTLRDARAYLDIDPTGGE